MDNTTLCINCFKEIDTSIGGGEICPHCSYNNFENQLIKEALPPNTILQDRYIVGRVTIFNSEGFTYTGYDKHNLKRVDIREFFPTTLACRDNLNIYAGEDKKGVFHKLYVDFVNMANSLAKIRNISGVIPISNLLSANNTCCIVYEHFESVSLKKYVSENSGHLNYNKTQELFTPLMSAFSNMHSLGIRHLGISPETLRVCSDGKLRIGDFSIEALRTVGSELTQDLVKNCTAYEQYTQKLPHLEYTDVYGFAVSIFFTLTGNLPDDVKTRLENPKLMLSNDVVRSIPQNSLVALASALQVKPSERTSSFESFKMDFLNETKTDDQVDTENVVHDIPSNTVRKSKPSSHPIIWLSLSFVISCVFLFFFFSDYLETSDFSLKTVIAYFEEKVDVEVEHVTGVPDMVGDYYSDWVQIISSTDAYQFHLEMEEVTSDTVKSGYIVSQNPTSEESVEFNGTVTVYVSVGVAERILPKISGCTYYEAVELLEAEGLIVEIEYEYSNTVSTGYVMWYGDDYLTGDEVTYGDTIPVVVSQGSE